MILVYLGIGLVLVLAPTVLAILWTRQVPDATAPRGWYPGSPGHDSELADTGAMITARRETRPIGYEDPPPHCPRCGYRPRAVAVYVSGRRSVIHHLSTIAPCWLDGVPR